MQLSPLQRFNESLIKLSVLLYQIDGKITLSEQDYLEQVIAELSWQSPISIEAFTNDAIHQARVAVDHDESLAFIKAMVDDLNFDAEKVVEVAMGVTGIDGERSVQETDILRVLTHKYLARELTVQHSVA